MASALETFGGTKQASSLSTFEFGKPDIDSIDGLLRLAQAQGGAVAQAAEELVHPSTSILSTVSSGFKKAFTGFIDIISTPSEVVAGILSKRFSVSEAIERDLRPSDVIFGQSKKHATTMQKIGGFLTRTALDILLDPLTYLTFGAGIGVFGLRATTKVTLTEEAAKKLGRSALKAQALSKAGQDIFKTLKAAERQSKGLTAAEVISTGDNTLNLAKKELDDLLSKTIDAPLDKDFARQAMGNLISKHPGLADTLLDKGGIKFFGKEIQSGQRISSAIKLIPGMTQLDHITKPTRQAINALFDPKVIKVNDEYIRLPDEFIELEQVGKDLAESLSDNRLTQLSNIIRANKLNVNEAKMLMAAVEAGKLPMDARLANAYKQLTEFDKQDFDFLRESGIPISFLDKHTPHVLVDTPVKNIPFKVGPSAKAGAAFERKLEGTIEELKEQGFEGFDDNLITAHAKRTLDNTRAGVSKQFLRSVSSKFGEPASQAPEGWVKLSLDGISKEGKTALSVLGENSEELLFNPAVAKRINEFVGSVINDDATKDILKKFDSIQNLWKASVTSIFPAFHGRNAISNVFLHFMDLGVHSFDPRLHAMSAQILSDNFSYNKLQRAALGTGKVAEEAKGKLHDLMTKTVFTDATGYKWSFGELRNVIKNKNIAFNKNVVGAIDIRQGQDELIRALFPESQVKSVIKKIVPISQEFAPFRIGRAVGSQIEWQARLVDFLANLRNTGDVTLAAQRTKQFLFDYNNLTNFERQFMKRLIPFYTFTRKNLEVQVRGLLQTPGRTAAQVTILSNIGDVLSGGELTDKERDALPDWIKSGIGILKSKNGSTIEILGSLGTPIEQPFQAFQPNQFLGSISPLLRVPVEQASGYSFFHGKALSEVTNAGGFKRAPKVLKDFIGFTEITGKKKDGTTFTWSMSLRPERMNLILNLPPTSRVFSALKQMDTADISKQSKALQQLIGLRPFTFDLDQEAARREKELKGRVENILNKAGVLAKFERTFIPKQ